MAAVSESSARYSRASVSSRSTLLPRPITRQTPWCSPLRMYFILLDPGPCLVDLGEAAGHTDDVADALGGTFANGRRGGLRGQDHEG